MSIRGTKPKPEDQRRNNHPLAHEWREVPNVPNEGAPSLPRSPGRRKRREPPEPPRPLGAPGQALWDRAWRDSWLPPEPDELLLLCEQMDERVALRVRVLRDADWHERQQLRALDAQVNAGLRHLRLDEVSKAPSTWPAATRQWWEALSQLPHTVLWDRAEWQFAFDTATLVAAFHNGDLRLAMEIRTRERQMGATADARRDQRIRYVEPGTGQAIEEDVASVTAMADYRAAVGGAS